MSGKKEGHTKKTTQDVDFGTPLAYVWVEGLNSSKR